jgi:hypothetical protein
VKRKNETKGKTCTHTNVKTQEEREKGGGWEGEDRM